MFYGDIKKSLHTKVSSSNRSGSYNLFGFRKYTVTSCYNERYPEHNECQDERRMCPNPLNERLKISEEEKSLKQKSNAQTSLAEKEK